MPLFRQRTADDFDKNLLFSSKKKIVTSSLFMTLEKKQINCIMDLKAGGIKNPAVTAPEVFQNKILTFCL